MRLSDECRLGDHVGKPKGCNGTDEYRYTCMCICHSPADTASPEPPAPRELPARAGGDLGPRTVSAILAGGPPMTASTAAELLLAVAESRNHYLRSMSEGDHGYDVLHSEVHTLRRAAAIITGDLGPLYGLMHSFDWTDDMIATLRPTRKAPDEQSGSPDSTSTADNPASPPA